MAINLRGKGVFTRLGGRHMIGVKLPLSMVETLNQIKGNLGFSEVIRLILYEGLIEANVFTESGSFIGKRVPRHYHKVSPSLDPNEKYNQCTIGVSNAMLQAIDSVRYPNRIGRSEYLRASIQVYLDSEPTEAKFRVSTIPASASVKKKKQAIRLPM